MITREMWESSLEKTAQCGMTAWNPDAKFIVAFKDPEVVAVVTWQPHGLGQDVQVMLSTGEIVKRRLTF